MSEWQPLDEATRLAIVRDILEEHPEHDIENSLAGALLGPPSPDRPDVPVWDYLAHVEANPATPLSDLAAIRFPVLYLEGDSSVDSIDEELRPLPRHLAHRPEPAFEIDAEAVVRRWAMLHDAGLVEWDPEMRGVRRLAPSSEFTPVLRAWMATLRPIPGADRVRGEGGTPSTGAGSR